MFATKIPKQFVAAHIVRHQFSDIGLVVDKAIANIPEIYEMVEVDRRSMANNVRRYETTKPQLANNVRRYETTKRQWRTLFAATNRRYEWYYFDCRSQREGDNNKGL